MRRSPWVLLVGSLFIASSFIGACGRIGYDALAQRDGGDAGDATPDDASFDANELENDAARDAAFDADDLGSGPVGIVVTPTTGLTTSESGGIDTFTVVLTSEPSADVIVTLSSSNADEGTASPSSLTFTTINWNAAQTVTVTGVDDAIRDGNVAYTIVTASATSSDVRYAGINADDVSVTNIDDESPGITLSRTTGLVTTEAGGTDTFTLQLNVAPTADVTISLMSDALDEATVSPSSLTFTTLNWSSPQTVTVTGVDDALADGDAPFAVVTGDTSSTDADYDGLDVPDLSGVNRDNESPGIVVMPTSGLSTSEAGGTAMFTVVLQSEPTSDVVLPVASMDTSEGTVEVSMLTFTPTNWNVPQAITATGVDDALADGDQMYTVTVGPATSDDGTYDTLSGDSVTLTNTDDESAGFVVTPMSGLVTSEAGGTASFTVVLRSQPAADVVFSVMSNDTTEGTVAPSSLTFTMANWDTPQTVTVSGVEDLIADGDQAYQAIVHVSSSTDEDYAMLSDRLVDLLNTDNETAGITVNPTSGLVTTEAGGTATFTIVLNSQPTADVVISMVSDVPLEGNATPAAVIFTMANWNTPQTITVTGVDDAVADGARVYHIVTLPTSSSDSDYNGLNPSDVTVTNTDNDSVGVTVTPTSGLTTTEAGATATFTMVLTSQPTANVTFNLMSSDTTEGTVSPTSVTFTMGNWSTPQTVTVTGVDDLMADGDVMYSIVTGAASSADSAYNAFNPSDVTVNNSDNDMAAVVVMPTSGLVTTEAMTTATFTVVLTAQPTSNVVISLMSSDTTEGTVSPASLTFTTGNWSMAQTVTVTGVDDSLDDGDIAYSIITGAATSSDLAYSSLAVSDVSLTNTDNDAAGITVSPTTGLVTSEAGGTATFTVVLTSQPSANVVVGLSSSNTLEGTVAPASLTFTNMNWSTPQTVTVTGVDDLAADGNVAYTIVTAAAVSADLTYNGTNPSDVSVTNNDNDAPGVTVSPTSGLMTTESLGTATFTIVLATMPSASVTISLMSSDTTEGSVSPASIVFSTANWSTPQTVTITGVNDDLDDGDIAYSIVTGNAVSTDPGYSGRVVSDVTVTNTDNDSAGVTVTPTSGLTTTEAGGTAMFTVVLTAQPTSNVVIALMSSNTNEGTVSPASLTFTMGNWNMTQTVTVTGVNDSIDDGDVAYSIVTGAASSSDGAYNGMAVDDVSVTNTDNDAAGITASPTSGLTTTEAGGTAMFTLVLTSQPTADVTISLMSSNTSEGTVSPASVTFTTMNWSMTQTVTVTGVNDSVDDGDIAYTIITGAASSADLNYNGRAVSDVSVTNTDNDTANILVAPTSGLMTTEAMGTATFTIVLASQPTANVSVSIMSSDTTEGTVSPASLTFTSSDWNMGQTVTVTGVDDFLDDGNVAYTIVTGAGVSSDPSYSGRVVADVSVTNTDNDSAGVTVTPTSGLTTTEAGGTATFTIVLDSQPTATVTILIAASDGTEGDVAPINATFTTMNWSTPQTITVTGHDDLQDDGDITYNVVTSAASSADSAYNGMAVSDVSVTNTDNDTAGITVNPTSGLTTTEAMGTAMFTIVLNTLPTANVTISLMSSNTAEGTVSPASVTFMPGNWSVAQTITVTGVDDMALDGNVAYTIITGAASSADGVYNGMAVSDVSVTNNDNDVAGVTVTPTSGLVVSETGSTATFTMVLTTAPPADVTIALSSSDTGEGTVSPSSVTFTSMNWNMAQTVTITGVADSMLDGDQSYTIITAPATSVGAYNGVNASDVSVSTTDFDQRCSSCTTGYTPVGGSFFTNTAIISDEGRYVIFSSSANTVVASDTNGVTDVFVRDRYTNTVTRENVSSAGVQANAGPASVQSYGLSRDGAYSCFASTATNLVASDTNGFQDVFVHNRTTGATTRVSVSTAGTQGDAHSGSGACSVSNDGRYVLFDSSATNLVASDTNGKWDLFLRDTMMNTTTRVNVATAGTEMGASAFLNGGSMSADGRYVAFDTNFSFAAADSNSVYDIYVRDTTMNTTTIISLGMGGVASNSSGCSAPQISSNGQYVAFSCMASNIVAGDTNSTVDVFRYDLTMGTVMRVSLRNNGTQTSSGASGGGSVSNAGAVAFISLAQDLVAGDTNFVQDAFIRDVSAGTTLLISRSFAGALGDSDTYSPTITGDGNFAAFVTDATNIGAGDVNGARDTYVVPTH